MEEKEVKNEISRRDILRTAGRFGVLGLLGALGTLLFKRNCHADGCGSCPESKTCPDADNKASDTVWQIDWSKCIQCGACATSCVLEQSAVKCFHAFDVCGYCDLCFAYYRPGTMEFGTGAEKQLCPTFAIKRKFVEAPYYEYTIDRDRCIGCAKCVKGCETFGNGSLYLQVCHDICVNCNDCAIARACPAGAFVKVPRDKPYLKRGKH